MSEIMIVSRKGAFKIAWHLFWLATGSRRVGIYIQDEELFFLGSDLIGERR